MSLYASTVCLFSHGSLLVNQFIKFLPLRFFRDAEDRVHAGGWDTHGFLKGGTG